MTHSTPSWKSQGSGRQNRVTQQSDVSKTALALTTRYLSYDTLETSTKEQPPLSVFSLPFPSPVHGRGVPWERGAYFVWAPAASLGPPCAQLSHLCAPLPDLTRMQPFLTTFPLAPFCHSPSSHIPVGFSPGSAGCAHPISPSSLPGPVRQDETKLDAKMFRMFISAIVLFTATPRCARGIAWFERRYTN